MKTDHTKHDTLRIERQRERAFGSQESESPPGGMACASRSCASMRAMAARSVRSAFTSDRRASQNSSPTPIDGTTAAKTDQNAFIDASLRRSAEDGAPGWRRCCSCLRLHQREQDRLADAQSCE